MNDIVCLYTGTRDELLVAYLYDEVAPDERAEFDRHLTTCARCRTELAAFAGVRVDLKRWTPPEPSFLVAAQRPVEIDSSRRPFWRWAAHLPVWARTAAALLFLGVSAGLANLDLTYTSQRGLSIRTGWKHVETDARRALSPEPAASGTLAPESSPWKADIASLEQQVRLMAEARQATVATAGGTDNNDAVIRRVRVLLQESERRQQRELALRVAEVARDAQNQRQADLVRIDRNLGLIQSRTGIEVMRTQQQMNSLAQRVSQRQ